MSKRNASQCRKGIELADYAESHGAIVERQTGSHRILRLPNGEHEVIPVHRHELGRGLRCKIIKHLLAAGITVLSIALVIGMML